MMRKYYNPAESEVVKHPISSKELDIPKEAVEESSNENVKIIYVSKPFIDKEIVKKRIPSKTTILKYLPVILSGLVLIYLLILVIKRTSGDTETREGAEKLVSAILRFLFYPLALATTTFTTIFVRRKGRWGAVIWIAFVLTWLILLIVQFKVAIYFEEFSKRIYKFW